MGAPETPRFGALLATLRKEAGFTQAALAERARMSQRGLQDLERGIHQAPRRDTLDLLATALRLSAPDRATFMAMAQGQASAQPEPATPLPLGSIDPLVPLVGRVPEQVVLDRFLAGEGTVGGVARVLVLAGEPGIGKTRLLLAAAQQAVSRGWSVLFGGCQRRGGQDPYAPVLEALVNHIRPRRPEQLSADLEGCAWLVRLLPELAGMLDPLPGGTLAPAQERRLIFEAIQRFLTNVAGPAGMLLILDDLQWAGPDALDLVNALARVTALPLRIVGAYRDTEIGPADPLNFLLGDLAQAGLVRLLPLGPLDSQEAETLLGDLLTGMTDQDRAAAAPVLERAGGMPFFLVSYAQAVQVGAVKAVPWDIAQGVRQRLALLPEAARQLLGVAAIVGRRVPRVLLTAAAGQREEEVPAGLEALCRARLLVEEGDNAYAFAHDVIREVVEADLGAARRAVLHGRVAAALEATPAARPELLAHHFIGSGDEAKAARYLELAGDRAWSERAHVAAEGRYGDAVDRLEHLGRARDAVRVREKLGDVLYGAGRYDAALGVLEQAADTYDGADDLDALTRVTAALGWAHSLRGTTPAGIARITALLERLERVDASPPALAKLYEALGWLLFTAGQYDASLVAGERAATLARARGDDRTVALAEENRINVLQMLGRLGDALRVGQAVLPLAERVGDLECLWRTHIDMAYTYVLRAEFGSGGSAFDRALALAEQVGNPARLAFTLALRSWIAGLTGDLTNARADLDRAASVSNQTDHSWYSVYLPIFLARLFLMEGASGSAATQACHALAISEQSGDLQARRWASTIMAEIDILEGHPEAARARLLPLLDRPGLHECDVTLLLPVLAWAHLELDQVDLAADMVEQALARSRPEEIRLGLVEALRVRTMIALRRERWDEAASSLEEGIALARSMPYPHAEARLRELEDFLHAQAGDGTAEQVSTGIDG